MTHRNDVGYEMMLPRTLPVREMADLTPYHLVPNERGVLTLRKGAPPKAVKNAAAQMANGEMDLGGFLDRIGVPK